MCLSRYSSEPFVICDFFLLSYLSLVKSELPCCGLFYVSPYDYWWSCVIRIWFRYCSMWILALELAAERMSLWVSTISREWIASSAGSVLCFCVAFCMLPELTYCYHFDHFHLFVQSLFWIHRLQIPSQLHLLL